MYKIYNEKLKYYRFNPILVAFRNDHPDNC